MQEKGKYRCQALLSATPSQPCLRLPLPDAPFSKLRRRAMDAILSRNEGWARPRVISELIFERKYIICKKSTDKAASKGRKVFLPSVVKSGGDAPHHCTVTRSRRHETLKRKGVEAPSVIAGLKHFVASFDIIIFVA